MFHEPQLFGTDLGLGDKGAVVGDQRLELAPKIVALNPVDHESTVTGSSSNAVLGVDIGEVFFDVLPALNQIIVRCTTYFRSAKIHGKLLQ